MCVQILSFGIEKKEEGQFCSSALNIKQHLEKVTENILNGLDSR